MRAAVLPMVLAAGYEAYQTVSGKYLAAVAAVVAAVVGCWPQSGPSECSLVMLPRTNSAMQARETAAADAVAQAQAWRWNLLQQSKLFSAMKKLV